MPDETEPESQEPQSLDDIVEKHGVYPIEAYLFLREGLDFTVKKIHGDEAKPDINRHVDGRQLSEGLRDYALHKYGFLAGTVLRRWNITCTHDFGKMVFILIVNQVLSKTDNDTEDDFRDVYDFAAAFDGEYRIESGT